MTRPKLLDLYCCEGGCSEGYRRAGWTVFGIDRFKFTDEDGKRRGHAQSRYPFPSLQADVIDSLERLLAGDRLTFTHPRTKETTVLGLDDFDATHASPPCQPHSITKHSHNREHTDHLPETRELLRATGLPYIIENVEGAPMVFPLRLCGTEFGLTATDHDGTRLHLRRHRLFESNMPLMGAGGCACTAYKRDGYKVGGAYGGGSVDRAHAQFVRRGGYTPPKPVREALLGIDWMTQDGLSQSIPPAYTEFLGAQLLDLVERAA